LPQEFQNAVLEKMFCDGLPWQILTAIKNSTFITKVDTSAVNVFHFPNRALVVPQTLFSMASPKYLDRHFVTASSKESPPIALVVRYNTSNSAHSVLKDHIKDQALMEVFESLIRRKITMKHADFSLPFPLV
jgi:hypothetical protein